MDTNKPQSSKYFKASDIKDSKVNDNDDIEIDDDIDAEELDKIISQKSLDKKLAEERINKVQTQQIDFTLIQQKHFSLLKNSNTILVNPNQRENPLLKQLKFVRFVITDTICPAHYVLYDNCCALFLSLKYHAIKPNYIYEQIAELKNKYQLSLLILMIDHLIYDALLKELTILSIRTNFTLLICWNYDEAAKHIENYRLNIDKSAEIIMGKNFNTNQTNNAVNQQSLTDALTSIKGINRTDAVTLLSTFETFENLVNANSDEISLCPGISMVKAERLHAIFNKPFIQE